MPHVLIAVIRPVRIYYNWYQCRLFIPAVLWQELDLLQWYMLASVANVKHAFLIWSRLYYNMIIHKHKFEIMCKLKTFLFLFLLKSRKWNNVGILCRTISWLKRTQMLIKPTYIKQGRHNTIVHCIIDTYMTNDQTQ